MLIPVLRRIRRSPSAHPAGSFLMLLVLVFAFVLAGCPCTESVVNNNPEFRWWLFSNFGASRICPEMLKVGVSLKTDPRSPSSIGRFFPTTCNYVVDDPNKMVSVQFSGTGYGYMQPAKRVGFSCSATVQLRPDFLISNDDVYVFGRMNQVLYPDFRVGYIENPAVSVATNIPGFGTIANVFGQQVLTSELTRGFTVVANEDRGNDFALGILMPPARPIKPFRVSNEERFTFANENVDVHGNQRDYLGPYEVSSGQSLYVTMSVQGPTVDVMIVEKRVGDAWREAYQIGQPLGGPPGIVVGGGPVAPGPQQTRKYSLQPGLYYVVIDNTPYAGLVSPPASPLNALFDPVARVSYVTQVGE